jgi:hypothetical protein
MSEQGKPGDEGKAVTDRWWVDSGEKRREPAKRPSGPVGSRFYRTAEGFDQEAARARLTDLNMKLLVEANPPEGGWGYVQLAETAYPERERERIIALVALPAYARGAFIDSGRSVRVLVTGTPIGERILELALGDAPSFDCWVMGDWVREAVYEDVEVAVKSLRAFIEEFLSPQGIAAWEALRAQA